MLLKNTAPTGSSSPVLPLDKAALKKVCVVGPLAASVEHMMGNYYGRFDSKASVTPLKGIQDELGELEGDTDELELPLLFVAAPAPTTTTTTSSKATTRSGSCCCCCLRYTLPHLKHDDCDAMDTMGSCPRVETLATVCSAVEWQ